MKTDYRFENGTPYRGDNEHDPGTWVPEHPPKVLDFPKPATKGDLVLASAGCALISTLVILAWLVWGQ